jgi:hypothetical protein
MVLLRPMFEGEHPKFCTRCSTYGLASPIRERSSFYPLRRGLPEYSSRCKGCDCARWKDRVATPDALARGRQKYAEKSKDPDYRERRREQQRRWREANRDLVRATQARFRERHREEIRERARTMTREERERVRENARINGALRRERRGQPLASVSQVERRTQVSGVKIPSGPFHDWLFQKHKDFENDAAFAATLGISPRRLQEWRRWDMIDRSIVERALVREGSIEFWELYGEVYL